MGSSYNSLKIEKKQYKAIDTRDIAQNEKKLAQLQLEHDMLIKNDSFREAIKNCVFHLTVIRPFNKIKPTIVHMRLYWRSFYEEELFEKVFKVGYNYDNTYFPLEIHEFLNAVANNIYKLDLKYFQSLLLRIQQNADPLKENLTILSAIDNKKRVENAIKRAENSIFKRWKKIDELKNHLTYCNDYIQTANEILKDLKPSLDLIVKYNNIPPKIEELKSWLKLANKKKLEEEKEFKKHGYAHAKAAELDQKSRTLARTVVKSLTQNERCPYCDCLLSEDLHVDHIYPINKGGLSTPENIVYCCDQCNLKKGNLGLFEFLSKIDCDIKAVSVRLLALGKKI